MLLRKFVEIPALMQNKILLVDDDQVMAHLIKYRLEKEGYTVVLAHDGKKALDMVKAESFDLLLTDLMLPKLNGFEVISIIRSKEKLNLPILAISILPGEEMVKRVYEVGADDIVRKPIDFDLFLLKVRRLVSFPKISAHTG